METLPAQPEVPLSAPPAESFDLKSSCLCPVCDCPGADVRLEGDVQVGRCPQCEAEFTPRVESISRQVIRRISEHRSRRLRRVAEALPRVMPGVNRLDYDLFKKIIDNEPADEAVGDAGLDLPPEA